MLQTCPATRNYRLTIYRFFVRLPLNLAQPQRVNFLPESPREYGSYEILADIVTLLIAQPPTEHSFVMYRDVAYTLPSTIGEL